MPRVRHGHGPRAEVLRTMRSPDERPFRQTASIDTILHPVRSVHSRRSPFLREMRHASIGFARNLRPRRERGRR